MGRALVNMNGGKTIKKKMQAGGVAGKQPKAGLVDPKGAYTKVQQRTLGSMKKGGKVKKAFLGLDKIFGGGGGDKNKTKIKIKIKNKSKGMSSDNDNQKSGLSSFLDDLLPGSDWKNGGKMSKAKTGSKVKKGMHKMPGGKMMKNSMMKMGGKTKKK